MEGLPSESERAALFDENYYKTGCGLPYERNEHWLTFFGLIADEIVRSVKPGTVFDAGCAKGFLVESLWDRGVKAYGIDISEFAVSQVRRDMQRYCRQGSILEPLKGRYDLVTCIEVLEHLGPEEAEIAIANLTAITDAILFSSTPSDFKEPTHYNVQPPIRWLSQFAAVGFWPDCVFDASFVAPHAFLLRRQVPPPEDVLALFSAKIRVKCALVEREQRIGGLDGKIAKLTTENNGLNAEMERCRVEKTALNAEVAQRQAETDRLNVELERCQAEKSALNAPRADPASSKSESVIAVERSRLLEQRILTANERVTELREENAALKSENTELLWQRDRLRQDVHEIAESSGWKLIERYRAWLWYQRKTRPGFFRVYEKIAARLLRAGLPQLAPAAPQAPVPADPATPIISSNSPARKVNDPEPFFTSNDPDYQRWIDENEPGSGELRKQREISATWSSQPLFSVILPVYRVSTSLLAECIQSVVEQSYQNWELCIAYGCPEDGVNRQLVADLAVRDPRIRLSLLEKNLGISGNSNAAIDLATGAYLVFLDHDDLLAPFALYETAELVNRKPEADLIYSDHDYIEESSSVRFQPLFKPDWSPEIMFSANYITHLTIIRTGLVREVGGFDAATDAAQDWDLYLRIANRTQHIEHIPTILYHWRVHPGSTALNSDAKSYAADAQLLTLSRHMERIGLPASPERTAEGLLCVRWKAAAEVMVSIVIPTRDKVDFLSKCVSSILEKTDYCSYELLIIDTGSREQTTSDYYAKMKSEPRVRIIDYAAPFNYSAVNNFGSRHARGELLLFLNNDTEIIHPHWLRELAGWACHACIGIVGGRLLRPDGAIQHAGVVVGLGGFADHPFAGLSALTYGMYGSTGWYRNYLAVTGACMMMRREVFDALGGFDESFRLCGSDVEICMRAWDRGYRVVYNPFAELIHHERQTRGADTPSEDFATSYNHYRRYLENGDPYWSPNLSVWKKEIGFRFKNEETSLQFVQGYLRRLNPSSTEMQPVPKTASLLALPRPPSEEQLLVNWFDFGEGEVQELRQQAGTVAGYQKVEGAVWFIPPFVNPFYGGIFTILRFASYWQSHKGVQNKFAICGSAEVAVMLARIKKILPDCKKSDIYVLPGIRDVQDIPPSDAAICTLWNTAYFALRYRTAARKFYFIQDYEPAFYSAGSASALVESTYRLGFYGITNTTSLREFYEEEYDGKAIHFTPCVDQKIFHPLEIDAPRPARPWQVCCYARPSHSRNAFELLSAALRRLKSRLGNRVRIVAAGENWNPADHNLEGIVENLGLLPYEDTARLYRESDVGVVLMLTRHPSYIPMELMASGCLVITNRNHWTRWLLEHERTCLLSHTTATSLADMVERGLTAEKLRKEITARALRLVREKYCDWTPEIEKVYEFMCNPDTAPTTPCSVTGASMAEVHNQLRES